MLARNDELIVKLRLEVIRVAGIHRLTCAAIGNLGLANGLFLVIDHFDDTAEILVVAETGEFGLGEMEAACARGVCQRCVWCR